MDLLYRALGVAAAVNNTLGRYSVNFIPSNLIIGIVIAALLMANVSGWLESVEAGSEPQVVKLTQVATGRLAPASYVRTSGLLVADSGFHYGKVDDSGNIKKVTMEFVPLIDRAAGRGVFVQLPAEHRFGSAPRELELTGMLRPMQPFLVNELNATNFQHEDIQMMPGLVLVADETPGDQTSWQTGIVLSGGAMGLLLLLTVKRNVIFRRTGDARNVRGPANTVGPAEIRATGTFQLEKHSRRFIEVPALLGTTESGEVGLFANVDASSNFMGMTYAKREGIWAMPLARGSVQNLEEGVMYYGRRAQPALRFTYRDAATGKTRKAILSVPSPADCPALIAYLKTAGASV